jgi:hypothetical protein
VRPFSLALPVLVLVLVAVTSVRDARADFFPDTTAASDFERSSFVIEHGGKVVGHESFIHFARRDTVFSYSTVRLDGLALDSPMPLEKRTTFLQRTLGSYPMYFESVSTARDTSQHLAVSCIFSDTTVVVYRERGERGIGEALALPPGRLYVFEPGVYHTVQLLLGDFVDGTQKVRKQLVFVPASQTFIDVTLTRGAKAPLRWAGKNVTSTKVGLSDGSTELIGWVDGDRRLLRLEAIGQALVVQREPAPGEAAASTKSAKAGGAKKKATTKSATTTKSSTTKSTTTKP